jgi:hypothetical protein
MSTSPQDHATLEFLDDTNYSSSPGGSRDVHAGSRLPGGMDATPGSPGSSGNTPAPSPPSAGSSASPQAPATTAIDGTTSTESIGGATPAPHPAPHRLVPRRSTRCRPRLFPTKPPPLSPPVLLPLRTPRPRLLSVAPAVTPDAPPPQCPRQSPLSLMCTPCAHVSRTGCATPLTVSESHATTMPPVPSSVCSALSDPCMAPHYAGRVRCATSK